MGVNFQHPRLELDVHLADFTTHGREHANSELKTIICEDLLPARCSALGVITYTYNILCGGLTWTTIPL